MKTYQLIKEFLRLLPLLLPLLRDLIDLLQSFKNDSVSSERTSESDIS